MLSRLNGAVWMEPPPDPDHSPKHDLGFKSMLDHDWYSSLNPNPNPNPNPIDVSSFCSSNPPENLVLHHQIDSSSCNQSPVFGLDASSHAQQHSYLHSTKSCFASLLSNNPFDNGFDSGFESGFNSSILMGFGNELCSNSDFPTNHLPAVSETGGGGSGFTPAGFEGFENSMFLNRSKVLRPLEVFPPVGAQPTLFQKRAALRQGSGGVEKLGNLGFSGSRFGEVSSGIDIELEKKRKRIDEDELDDGCIDISSLNYNSDDFGENSKVDESGKNSENNSNPNSTVTGGGGDQKGKRKGLPAKNLMAERRRRKKLNDRLYMLRSVVPKISKMDRASILGDAIKYLKELLQRINDLQNELESTPPGSLLPAPTSFHPLTPTLPTLPSRVKDELCPSSLPSPKNQTTRVEVKVREGRAVNIHMFCARRPGLLLSTMRALDNLGLDIQQAVISCFNGFALDVFRAEHCREGLDVLPEQIKAVLMDSAGFHSMM